MRMAADSVTTTARAGAISPASDTSSDPALQRTHDSTSGTYGASALRSVTLSSRRSHEDSLRRCDVPGLSNQRACLVALLADADVGLNRVYHQLIAALRRGAGLPADAQQDPPQVAQLRTEQRHWLDFRDAECRRRGTREEGKLWALSRARCLGAFAEQRAGELAATLRRVATR
jgi:uncharacterized protein YecT (DUF1311 family)